MLELPQAQLVALTANINRDSKKNRKPFTTLDFCYFHDAEANKPQARAAAAYMRLVKDNLMPGWALFCFGDFKHADASLRESSECAIIGESWMLLAPEQIDNGYTGLLLAEFPVSGKEITGVYREEVVTVKLPEFQDFVLAKEGVEIDELRPPIPLPVPQSV